jgi:hypothetical protein
VNYAKFGISIEELINKAQATSNKKGGLRRQII